MNAVRAGIVEAAHHYLYASSSNYFNGEGLLEVKVIDFGVRRVVFLGVRDGLILGLSYKLKPSIVRGF